MAAASTDLFQEYGLATATTLDSNYTIGDPSFTVASTANWPTATGITFAVDVVDGDGVQVPGSYNEYVGVVSSGTSITGVSHVNGSDRNYSAGATTRVYQAVSKERENRLVEGILEEHNQDGTHSDITADTATISTTLTMPDNTVTAAKIADGAVTPAKLLAGTGTDWVWQSWTPTFTNLSVGSGTLDCKYVQTGKTVHFRLSLTFAANTSVSGAIRFSLPKTAASYPIYHIIGTGGMNDGGAFIRPLFPSIISTTVVEVFAIATVTAFGGATATVPATWTTSDVLMVTGTYEAA